MSLVVDASVALKWFVDELGSDAAAALIERDEELLAPELLLAETLNGAWNKGRAGQVEATLLDDIVKRLRPPLVRLVGLAPLAVRAGALALALDHPVYDCFYLALAERARCPLVTADARLLARLRERAWPGEALRLDDVAS